MLTTLRCLGCLFFFISAITASAAGHPNVLLVITDDQGFGDVRSHGNPYVQTPHQDALAASGARFDRFFVSPVCAPTRASLLTGRYHLRTGVSGVTRGYENVRADEITLAEVFRDVGYATGAFGKWHNGRHMPMHPNGQGFDTFLGFCGGHWNTYFDPPLELNGRRIQRDGYIADIFTDSAIEFMQTKKEMPWFCYVAFNTPHSPWRVPDKYWDKYNGLGLDAKAQCAYAMVENIDDNLGRMLKYLEDTGEADETIVIFLTDNGANSPRFNAGMKGRKGSVDEGGTRVPFFIRYPGKIAPKTVVLPITFHLDVLPTLAELCGISLDADHRQRLDGRSVVPLLSGKRPADWPSRMLFTDTFRIDRGAESMRGAVRTDRWRATMTRGKWQLYDMQADPGQEQNVAAEHPDVTQELSEAFETWFASIDQDRLQDRQIPVGHPARNEFVLTANEADLHPGYGEQIQYTGDTTAGYANSWITNWTSPEAYPSWPIEVLSAGEYTATLEYCCRREDVGCQLELTIGEQSHLVNIPKAHDPPLLHKPDHLYSSNYQDKASWATANVGKFTLHQGRYEVTLKIRTLTGARVIELNSVRLTRKE